MGGFSVRLTRRTLQRRACFFRLKEYVVWVTFRDRCRKKLKNHNFWSPVGPLWAPRPALDPLQNGVRFCSFFTTSAGWLPEAEFLVLHKENHMFSKRASCVFNIKRVPQRAPKSTRFFSKNGVRICSEAVPSKGVRKVYFGTPPGPQRPPRSSRINSKSTPRVPQTTPGGQKSPSPSPPQKMTP